MSVYHICRADSIFLLGKLRISNPLFSGNKKGYCIAPITGLFVKQKVAANTSLQNRPPDGFADVQSNPF